jgi:hypothetical protein
MAKIDNFYGNRNIRNAEDWGADASRNSIAADSSMMVDRSRIATEPRYVENPAFVKARKKAERTGTQMNWDIPSGKIVDEPLDLMEHVKKSMGTAVRGTIYKNEQKKKGNNGTYPVGRW